MSRGFAPPRRGRTRSLEPDDDNSGTQCDTCLAREAIEHRIPRLTPHLHIGWKAGIWSCNPAQVLAITANSRTGSFRPADGDATSDPRARDEEGQQQVRIPEAPNPPEIVSSAELPGPLVAAVDALRIALFRENLVMPGDDPHRPAVVLRLGAASAALACASAHASSAPCAEACAVKRSVRREALAIACAFAASASVRRTNPVWVL